MKVRVSMKHLQVDKANQTMLIVIASASIISAFCLMSTKALLNQSSYQRRVLAAKHTAVKQLKSNISAVNTLVTQYNIFESANPNIIGGQGGTKPGNGINDGDNARIVLDALPSQYDFPALISSVEKIVTNAHISTQGISGTDQGQATTPSATDKANLQPITLNFSLNTQSDYSGAQTLIKDLERSIRPIDITNIQLSGSAASMNLTVTANTYYQPAKSLTISQKEIK